MSEDAGATVQPGTEGAESPNGDGQGGNGYDGLYEKALSTAPAELRPYLEDHLKEINRVNAGRFQEHAEARKRWEAYEGIEGLKDTPPENLEALLQFSQIAADPEQFNGWIADTLETIANGDPSIGLEADPDRAEQVFFQLGQRLGLLEDTDGDGTDDDPGESQGLEQLRESLLGEMKQMLAPVQQFIGTQETEGRVAEQDKAIDKAFTQLDGADGLTEDQKVHVLRLAKTYADEGLETDEVISKAFADYQQITGGAQGNLVDRLTHQPAGGTPHPGGADNGAEEITSFRDAKRMAKARVA